MLFLVVTWVAWAAAQSSNFLNISSAVSGQSQLTHFATYLGLFPTLVTQIDAGNITVLAPSDEAFANYWKSREAASNDTEDLEPILTYHVLQGVHADTTLDGPPQFITTLLTNSSYTNVTGGQRVEVVSSGGHLKVYSAAKAVSNIVAPNIPFTGGVVNIIDSVLMPPTNVRKTAINANLTGFLAVIVGTGLDPHLAGVMGETSDWTCFVTNTTQPQYLNVTQQVLFEFEEYACAQGEVVYSSLLTDGKKLRTVLGSDVTITVQNGSTYVNAAKIIAPDYLTSNGVLHIIDSALDPNNTSGPPSPGIPTSVSTPTTLSSPQSSLSTGAKAGIGIGAGVGGLAIIALAWYFVHKRKQVPMPKAKEKDGQSTSKLSGGDKHLVSELDGRGLVNEIG